MDSSVRARPAGRVEEDHHGRPSFRVAGRIFATLWDDGHLNVMVDEPGIHTAVQGHPEACEEFLVGRAAGRRAGAPRSRG